MMQVHSVKIDGSGLKKTQRELSSLDFDFGFFVSGVLLVFDRI